MAQPSTQELLDTGHAFYGYFWYANGTGLWDARNGAMATKTGSGTVTATGSGGENVANSSGTTNYTMASALTLSAPHTIAFKVKRTSASGDAGMVIGNADGSNKNYFWVRPTEIRPFSQTVSNTNPDSWATFHYVKNSDGTGAIYKNGSLMTTLGFATSAVVSRIMTGYTSDTYALDGALEYLHIIPGLAASAGQVSSLYADPYQALAASTDGTGTGTPASITIVAPTATASGTGGADCTGTGAPASVSLTAPTATAAGTTAGSGTITTPALKNNTGTVLASISGWSVNVYNVTTGAFIVQKTGLTTSAGGVLTITDASIVSGTTYAYEPFHATYGRRLPTSSAA